MVEVFGRIKEGKKQEGGPELLTADRGMHCDLAPMVNQHQRHVLGADVRHDGCAEEQPESEHQGGEWQGGSLRRPAELRNKEGDERKHSIKKVITEVEPPAGTSWRAQATWWRSRASARPSRTTRRAKEGEFRDTYSSEVGPLKREKQKHGRYDSHRTARTRASCRMRREVHGYREGQGGVGEGAGHGAGTRTSS